MLGSPFMARLMALIAKRLSDRSEVGAKVLNWSGDPSPNADNVPLRLAGALHALKLDGLALTDVYPPHNVPDNDLWRAVETVMQDHAPRILKWLQSPPQTNEVRRSAILLAGLAVLNQLRPGPVALYELGTSGGLNLRADRFRLDLPGAGIGPPDAAVRLFPDWSGPLPPLDLPRVVSRQGVDLNPLDPMRDADRLRLLAYLWPDQTERITRTEAAMQIAGAHPAEITAADAGAWLTEALAEASPDAIPLVFHTIAWQYFPPETQAVAEAAIASSAPAAARLSMEADTRDKGAAITLTTHPDHAPILLGRADFHGRWITWNGV